MFELALDQLETAILNACLEEEEKAWPAQVSAGICAGVDFAISTPGLIEAIASDSGEKSGFQDRYERLIGRLTGFLRVKAPIEARLPTSTDEAMVAGIVGLVGDHVRVGRIDRLKELRPELVLLVLLPYLGFTEAQRWAEQVADA